MIERANSLKYCLNNIRYSFKRTVVLVHYVNHHTLFNVRKILFCSPCKISEQIQKFIDSIVKNSKILKDIDEKNIVLHCFSTFGTKRKTGLIRGSGRMVRKKARYTNITFEFEVKL